MTEPLVSIIIPAYNAERFIERSLQSAFNQTYSNIEVIVVDDGSTDSTAEKVKSHKDPRLVYVYQQNRGQGPARNTAIKQAKGDFVTFLDADDYYLPHKVAKEVEYLQKHPEYGLVYCNALNFYSNKPDRLLKKKRRQYPSGDIFLHLLRGCLINPNTLMLSKDILRNGLLFAEGAEGRCNEDWEFYLRVSRAGHSFGWLDEDLVVVEIRPDSHTQWNIQWLMKQRTLNVLENLFSEFSEQEKTRCEAEKVLRTHRTKLAVAYLVNEQKGDFLRIIKDVWPTPIVYTLAGVTFLIPSILLRVCLIKLWKLRQRYSFFTVHT